MTVPWLSMEPTSQDHKPVVRCTPGGGGRCVLREPPWSMQAEQQGPSTLQSDTLCMPETPQYLSTDTTATHVALLRGVEFETHGGRHQHHLGIFYRPISLVPSATPTPNCLFSLSLLSTPIPTGGAWSTTAT